ncbi:MAG: TolC family protein, partial [Rikenellaceae bacterium]
MKTRRLRKIYTTALLALGSVVSVAQEPLSLSDAITIGLKNNFDIVLAQKDVEMAQMGNSWGMAGGLPSLTLNGNVAVGAELISPATVTGAGQISADLLWTLFNGFNIKATKSLLESSEELAQGTEILTVENTIHSIITSYYYVLLQQEMLKINETMLKISEDRLSQQEVSKEIGASGTYEYVQAQSDYLTDKSSYIKQEVILRDAIRSLNLLLSLPADTQWYLNEKVETPAYDYSQSEMQQKMFSDNRTLKNQYINLKSKDYELQQSRSTLYPSIGLYGSVAGGSTSFSSSDYNFAQPQVGVTVSFNLFNGGKTKRNIDIARLSREAEVVSTQQMKLEMENELSSELDEYNVYREIVKIDDQQVEVATLLLELSEDRYRNGTINSFNFREVQLSYLQSANTRLNSIYSLIVVNCNLLKLTGGIISYTQQ